MFKNLLFVPIFFVSIFSYAQELNCSVYINAEQTGQPNNQVFRILETQLTKIKLFIVIIINWTCIRRSIPV
jgi:hypothetical protein